MTTRELASEIKPPAQETVRLRQGKVTATDAGPPVTVSVEVGGATAIAGVRYLASYSPVVDDIVWLIQQGPDLLVLGDLA